MIRTRMKSSAHAAAAAVWLQRAQEAERQGRFTLAEQCIDRYHQQVRLANRAQERERHLDRAGAIGRKAGQP